MAGHARDLLAILALMALASALYHPALGLFWHADDFYNLRFSRQHTPLQILTSPATWAELPFKMVTPLMFHSFQLDLELAGASAPFFYAHQLLAVGFCAVALFLVLRLWLPLLSSAAGGALFLLGAPTTGLAVTLMVRHYPEGLVLLLAALGSFVLSVRSSQRRSAGTAWSLASALFYAAACLAKEIAVPLPFALLVLPEGDLRSRLRRVAPHAVVLALYLAYRRYLLGVWVGGYGWAIEPKDWPLLALTLPFKMAREMAGPGAWGWALVAALLLLGIAGVFRSDRPASTSLRWLAAIGLVLLPVLPVSVEMASRYAAAPWMLLAAACAFGVDALDFRSWRRLGILAGLALIAILAWLSNWTETWKKAERNSVENRAFLSLHSGDVLLHPVEYPAAMAELRRFEGTREGAWAYDELAVCPPVRRGRVWEFEPQAERVVERSAALPALCAAWRSRLRPEAPLSVTFQAAPSTLSWELGPYEEGRYALLIGGGTQRFELPRRGSFQRPPESLVFRLRYESPQGWITYSDELVGDFPRRPSLAWSRP